MIVSRFTHEIKEEITMKELNIFEATALTSPNPLTLI